MAQLKAMMNTFKKTPRMFPISHPIARPIVQLCGCWLGILIGCTLPSAGHLSPALALEPQGDQPMQSSARVIVPPVGVPPGLSSEHPMAEVLQQLAQAQVVYLGEIHDSEADHQAQRFILEQLHTQRPHLTIAMEMFQRPFQSVLDRYLKGEISEQILLERTQYQKRWGFPWRFYQPIVQFAKQQQLPVVALNAPSEVVRQVGRKGLDSLKLTDRRFIPPLSAIRLEPDSYRQRLQQLYNDMHQGKGNSQQFDRFFQAQVLWDETMAERISQLVQANPDRLVVVLVGQGHVTYGEGIPQRVARRLRDRFPKFTQFTLLLNPSPDLQSVTTETRPIADFFWMQPLNSSTAEAPTLP
ncbi:ChaN family lipoprotein [Alkalinema pantanalense CENA528]|uniref:ChaN family lipoprotein n=1 Tax=Alkalinema pantanalense TaxID=1620705 RepID=UPI003D6EDE94